MAKNVWMAFAMALAGFSAAGCSETPKLVEVPAGLSVEPVALSFGEVYFGERSDRRVQFENTGMAVVLSLEAVEVPGSFTVTPAAFSVAPGGKQTVQVTFQPDAAGPVAGTIVFRALEGGLGAEVAVEGTGLVRQVRVAEKLDFGKVRIGSLQTLPLVFSSESAALFEVTVDSPSDRAFSLTPGSILLEPGSETTIAVTFSPQMRGPVETALGFRLCGSCEEERVTLTGQGADVVLTATPAPVGFESVALGLTRQQSVKIANTGDLDVEITSVRVVGEAFAHEEANMFGSLPVGAETTLEVSFTPLAEGVHQGTLEVEGKAEGAEVQRLLSVRLFGGTGGPFLVVSPTQIDFGSLYVGLAPLRHTVTLTNVGDPAPLTLLSATIEDDAAGAFRVEYEPLSFIEPIATVTVEFGPGRSGSHSGRLVLRTGVHDQAEFSVPLTGIAKPPSSCDPFVGADKVYPHWVRFREEDSPDQSFDQISIFCELDIDFQPCGPCVFSNPRIAGPDARYFKLGKILEAHEPSHESDPAVLPFLLYSAGMSEPSYGLQALVSMTPDTPAGVLLHANFLYDINGITYDYFLVANRENIPPR